jgi:hypothetical protein
MKPTYPAPYAKAGGTRTPQGKGAKAVRAVDANEPYVDYDPEVRPTKLPAKSTPRSDYKTSKN